MLLHGFYVIPDGHPIGRHTVYWDRFGHPPLGVPHMNWQGMPYLWWFDEEKSARIDAGIAALKGKLEQPVSSEIHFLTGRGTASNPPDPFLRSRGSNLQYRESLPNPTIMQPNNLRWPALTLICAFALATPPVWSGEPSHGLSYFGDLKYGPDIAHFDYANPDAPKAGASNCPPSARSTT